jgi:hypothetical protein
MGVRAGGTRARAALLVGALASLAVFASEAGAQDAAPELPDSFAAAASAQAIGIAAITPALVPVEGLFDLGFVEGRGTYERSNQEGRASVFYPGSGIVTGPSLLCGTFLGPEIPPEGEPLFGPVIRSCLQYQYPLSVTVDPLVPDAATEGGLQLGELSDPISFGAVGARAHAGEDATTTEAEVADLRVLGLPALGSVAPLFDLLSLPAPDATLASVESVRATTDQRIVDGALVADANATVTGLRVVGGLVRIGSIVSHSRIEVRAGEEPVVTTDLEVSGVELAGQPAQITEDGAVVGTTAPSGPLLQQLLSGVVDAVQDTGLRITVLPEEQGESGGIPFAGVGGVVVEFTTPLDGLPPVPGPTGDADLNGDYGIRLQIGTTGVRGFADAFGASSPITRPPAATGVGQAGTPSSGGGAGGGSGGPTGGASTPPPTAAPPTTAAPVADAAPTSFLDDLFAERLAFLYLSFTLTAMALCLAPRLSLPARLPSSRA